MTSIEEITSTAKKINERLLQQAHMTNVMVSRVPFKDGTFCSLHRERNNSQGANNYSWVMVRSKTGKHTIHAGHLMDTRVAVHWHGFLENNQPQVTENQEVISSL